MRAALAEMIGETTDGLAALIADLTAARITVAAAESLTGGLLLAVLTEVPGSSAVVRGGLVVYATDLKTDLAGVDAALLATGGAVQADVAGQLAEGVRERCRAIVGLGLTGVAGPAEQDGRPVGTFHVALRAPGWQRLISAEPPHDGGGGPRFDVRAGAVRSALKLVREYVNRS